MATVSRRIRNNMLRNLKDASWPRQRQFSCSVQYAARLPQDSHEIIVNGNKVDSVAQSEVLLGSYACFKKGRETVYLQHNDRVIVYTAHNPKVAMAKALRDRFGKINYRHKKGAKNVR